jgi:hypothetical protein
MDEDEVKLLPAQWERLCHKIYDEIKDMTLAELSADNRRREALLKHFEEKDDFVKSGRKLS